MSKPSICRESRDKAGEGGTLTSLSDFYLARGDYDTAQRYLEASLTIQRDVGDKVGLTATLHKMGLIAWGTENIERAMTLWSDAFALARETQDAGGLFSTAWTLGVALEQSRKQSEARRFLLLAVEVGKAAGFGAVQQVEAILRGPPSAEA